MESRDLVSATETADHYQAHAGLALILGLGGLVAAVLFFVFVFKKGPATIAKQQQTGEQAGQAVERPRGRDRAQAGARRRRAAAAAAAAARGGEAAHSDSEDEGAVLDDPGQGQAPAPTRRKDAYEARRAARDREREEQEAREEAEAARQAAAEAARQEAEAAQWVGLISTEGAGSSAVEAEHEEQGLMHKFVTFVKQRKSVELQELAAHFGLRVQDAIDRIRALEQMGHLTGVMDDRGKYIFISMEEMEAVANYIQSKGRVAISELAAKSNIFIDLQVRDVAESGEELDIDLEGLTTTEPSTE